jgi:hypothetical protein
MTGLTNATAGGGVGGGTSVSVTTTQDEYLSLLGSLDSAATYRSPADCTSAFGTASNIFVWGLPFDPAVEQIVAVVRWDNTSQIAKIWNPQESQVFWSPSGPGSGMITIADGDFESTDVAHEVIISGPYRGAPETDETILRDVANELRQLNTNIRRLELHLIQASDMEPSDGDTKGMK